MATLARGGIFRSPAFLRFYAGQTLSYLGDGLRAIAIPLLVFRLTGSAVSIGITFALEIAPFALFSVVGGSLADRIARRTLMLWCDGIRFVVMAIFAVAYARDALSLWSLYTGVALLAVAAAIFQGCQASSIPYLLGKDRAKPAVAALIATEQGMNLVAPPLGGALLSLAGALPALALNALTYLTSQVSIASVRDFGPDKPGGLPSWRHIWDDTIAGWRFIDADPALRALTYAQFFINGFIALAFVVLIPYLKREFAASDQLVGIAFGAISIGTLLGSMVSGRTYLPFGRSLIVAFLLDALMLSVTVWTHSLLAAIAALAAASACNIFAISSLIAWRMRIIPEELVGRVFGVIRLIVVIGMLPGSIAGGYIGDHAGTRTALLVASCMYALLTLLLASNASLREDRR